MTLQHESGFTLVELLMVVAIVGIVSAIAAPELFRARVVGNEAAAVATLRVIHSGQTTYASSCARGGYAQSLEDLAKAPSGGTVGFVSPDVATNGVTKSGYVLNVGPGTIGTTVTLKTNTCNDSADDALSSFFAEAHPTSVGGTGQRSFGVDQRSTIYQDNTGATFSNTFPASATAIQ